MAATECYCNAFERCARNGAVDGLSASIVAGFVGNTSTTFIEAHGGGRSPASTLGWRTESCNIHDITPCVLARSVMKYRTHHFARCVRMADRDSTRRANVGLDKALGRLRTVAWGGASAVLALPVALGRQIGMPPFRAGRSRSAARHKELSLSARFSRCCLSSTYALLLSILVLWASPGSSAGAEEKRAILGMLSSDGGFSLNGVSIRGTATLFEGDLVEARESTCRIWLHEGHWVQLSRGARGHFFSTRLALETGSARVFGFRVDASGLTVAPERRALATVSFMNDTSQGKLLEVHSMDGALHVFERRGIEIARLGPGDTVNLASGAETSPSTYSLTGCAVRDGKRVLLSDSTTKLSFELQGVEVPVGRALHITGVSAVEGSNQGARVIIVRNAEVVRGSCKTRSNAAAIASSASSGAAASTVAVAASSVGAVAVGVAGAGAVVAGVAAATATSAQGVAATASQITAPNCSSPCSLH